MTATVGATVGSTTFPLRHGGLGPFISGTGSIYWLARDSSIVGAVLPMRATNPMSSFSIAAGGSKLISSGTGVAIEAMRVEQNGNVLYVFTQISTGAVYFNFFTMGTDAWGLTTSPATIAAA